jgi:hypothetical protein
MPSPLPHPAVVMVTLPAPGAVGCDSPTSGTEGVPIPPWCPILNSYQATQANV